ncbi:hypothetical protein BJF92_13630 [Rhizobium rhizosphaerae]|uniref:Uncharacterized protein n=1 Tax=Xaviernesmea rhizosphaerae TaxID=1672749 RepID=A0A1Q9AI16_9HYPH|nr:hypothetical protein [Xaviernesmea rhizosphaerae]OLP54845.1 hypothetical protein BJF92_13630 [Xaviernesmea rhizosphaerae]
MQHDIQSLTARGLKLHDKLGMLDNAERSLVLPYVACLELFLDDVCPKPAVEIETSNIVSFEDVTSRRVQRAEIAQRRTTAEPRRGVNVFGDDIWSDYD